MEMSCVMGDYNPRPEVRGVLDIALSNYDPDRFKDTIMTLTRGQIVSREDALRQIDEGTQAGRALYHLVEYVYDQGRKPSLP